MSKHGRISLSPQAALELRALMPSLVANITKTKACPNCGTAIPLKRKRCVSCSSAIHRGHQTGWHRSDPELVAEMKERLRPR